LSDAIGTTSPVDDLGLVDLVALVVIRRKTRGEADRAIDIDGATAVATDQMMVVVADPGLVARW
jgi:hypothetical protein